MFKKCRDMVDQKLAYERLHSVLAIVLPFIALFLMILVLFKAG